MVMGDVLPGIAAVLLYAFRRLSNKSDSRMSLPTPAPEPLKASRALTQHIQAEISSNDGWISFARYMELALYTPGLGYYSGGSEKFGAGGDFVTAPQISPLFGRVLARQFADVLQQAGGGVLELGAGTGLLAAQILGELDALGMEIPYSILEVSGNLRERQQETLRSSTVNWLETLPEKFTGVIFGNEVLDALPVHLIHWTENGPLERGVIVDKQGFGWQDRPIAEPVLLAQAHALDLPAGYVSEINLAAPALVKSLAERLECGLLLFIDYGFGRAEYYHPQRHMGTLRVHYRHHALDDPFYLPGLCDLTAHVDFTTVADAGLEAGLNVCGYTTQANFLLAGGITTMLAEMPAESAATYLPLSTGVQKLLSPAEMGELFKVIGFTKGNALCPSAFSLGDQRYRL
jgi:SAM-dependent MidA family methyltransferase